MQRRVLDVDVAHIPGNSCWLRPTAPHELVTVEYEVAPEQAADFLEAVRRHGRIRRRDGARRWGIFRDTETARRYVETFIVGSWAEHLRQHERLTRADRDAEEQVRRYVSSEPKVRHLISPEDQYRLTRYCARSSISSAESVLDTPVMVPASFVRRRALKSSICLTT
jgi:hypothetical protein